MVFPSHELEFNLAESSNRPAGLPDRDPTERAGAPAAAPQEPGGLLLLHNRSHVRLAQSADFLLTFWKHRAEVGKDPLLLLQFSGSLLSVMELQL